MAGFTVTVSSAFQISLCPTPPDLQNTVSWCRDLQVKQKYCHDRHNTQPKRNSEAHNRTRRKAHRPTSKSSPSLMSFSFPSLMSFVLHVLACKVYFLLVTLHIFLSSLCFYFFLSLFFPFCLFFFLYQSRIVVKDRQWASQKCGQGCLIACWQLQGSSP